jgi:hypothetical protein
MTRIASGSEHPKAELLPLIPMYESDIAAMYLLIFRNDNGSSRWHHQASNGFELDVISWIFEDCIRILSSHRPSRN